MIIGNGMLAKRFNCEKFIEDTEITIFASGVSNSSELRVDQFDREEQLLLLQPRDAKLIYFSTCSIFDADVENSLYVVKKKYFEQVILNEFKDSLIIRLPQVVGNGGNKNNLVNFFYDAICNQKKFSIQKYAYRNLIDIDDVFYYSNKIISSISGSINLASTFNTSVLEIIETIEFILKRKGDYSLVNKGSNYPIDIERCISLFDDYSSNFHSSYSNNLIKKYFEN